MATLEGEATMAALVGNLQDLSIEDTEMQVADHVGNAFREWVCRSSDTKPTVGNGILSLRSVVLREVCPAAHSKSATPNMQPSQLLRRVER